MIVHRKGAAAVVTLAAALLGTPVAGAHTAAASSVPCVRVRATCHPTVQSAIDAAQEGDTVHVPAGRFSGGIVVTKSVTIMGHGAASTHLVGGEHILTVGTWMAASEPNVRISGVTIRGGRAHTSPESIDFTGKPGVFAGGGGLEIAAGQGSARATVTVTDSVIKDNRAIPTGSLLPTPEQEPNWPHCPDGFCTVAASLGGGIENWGDLTLVRTRVTGNVSGGPLTADADGGGIQSWGNLTLRSSVVSHNHARAVAPHGRFAEGGAIFMGDQTRLTVVGSVVTDNLATLRSRNPVTNPDGSSTESLVNAGGIHVNDGSQVTIESSHIDDNTAMVHNPQGQAAVINSGLQLIFSDLRLTNSSVSGNHAFARVKDVGDQGPLGGALSWCRLGTLTGLRAVGNSTVVRSVGGDAGSAAAIFAGATMCNGFDPGPSTLSKSVVEGNTSTAIARGGRADVFGAGIITASSLTMRRVVVSGNRGLASGDDGGEVQGGGIWNGAFPLPFLEGLHSRLRLERSAVTQNSVSGQASQVASGGGIYTRDPITRTATIVVHNRPDQCVGCTAATTSSARAPALSVHRSRHSTSNLRDTLVSVGLARAGTAKSGQLR